jgi:hypothetical protein
VGHGLIERNAQDGDVRARPVRHVAAAQEARHARERVLEGEALERAGDGAIDLAARVLKRHDSAPGGFQRERALGDAREEGGARGGRLVVEVVGWVVEARRVAVADEHVGAGPRGEHEREVLRSHLPLRVVHHPARDVPGGVSGRLDAGGVVHGGRAGLLVEEGGRDAVRRALTLRDLPHAAADHRLHRLVEGADRAVDRGRVGDDVVRAPGMDLRDRHHEVAERVVLRLTIVWIAWTMPQAATTGSRVSWGMAPWPPRPWTWMVNVSTAAMIGPGLVRN